MDTVRVGGFVVGGLVCAAMLCGVAGCSSERSVALVGGWVFMEPGAPPIEDGVVVMEGERIAAVGRRGEVRVPGNAQVVDVAGRSVLAGFWNSHVHFMEQKWNDAATADAGALSAGLEEIALRWGFVRVVDTGSVLANTAALRERVRSGEVMGPDIWMSGLPFVPPDGNPFYAEPLRLPELRSPDEAREAVRANFAAGADHLKVFSGSPVEIGRAVYMPLETLVAASGMAHEEGGLVLAHPTTNEGITRAIEGGVDIIVHTTPDGGQSWDEGLIASMRGVEMSVVPTLTLWKWELERRSVPEAAVARFAGLAQSQLAAYARAGGSILFGTDVGYIDEYDPTREYELMAEAGLTFEEILRSLTTEPARRFGVADAGVIEPGKSADVVIVSGRPDVEIRALAKVTAVYLRGERVYGE